MPFSSPIVILLSLSAHLKIQRANLAEDPFERLLKKSERWAPFAFGVMEGGSACAAAVVLGEPQVELA
jgi:hypothetical protein